MTPTRRDALAVAALAAARPTLVERENQKPGTADWQITYAKLDGKFRSRVLEGYCSRAGVRAGETIRFHLSADPAAAVRLDLYRLGYYGGTGARQVAALGPFTVSPQPTPAADKFRLRECRWPVAHELTVPADWPSGVYLGKLSADRHRFQSYVTFVVADDRPAGVLFQCSTNTWQAYNKWPANDSLYDNDRPDKRPLVSGVRVSFDRPYAKYPQVTDSVLSLGSGEFLLWEFPVAYWLEQHGYDVTYCTNEDVHAGGLPFLKRAKAVLSVGHDEYWTRQQYDACLAAVKAGVNFGFFSGNAVCFGVPYSPASDGRPNRVIERTGRFGGIRPGEEKYMADLPERLPSEAALIGAQTVSPFNGSGDWTVTKPDHWAFAGTGMKKGESIPGLVGWEFHGDPAPIPGLEVLAAGTTLTGGGQPSHYEATIYPAPAGNTVFNAATIFWGFGLSLPPGVQVPFVHDGRPHGPDRRVQQIMRNLLARWTG